MNATSRSGLLRILLASLVAACGVEPADVNHPTAATTQSVSPGAPSGCPDPSDPAVWYLSRDLSTCAASLFSCAAGQRRFSDSCGCGCVGAPAATPPACPAPATPGVHYVSQDARKCAAAFFQCAPHQRPIDEACGCGCLD
ncbi:MAG: hypothetical protein INH41_02300 [Myxococcaceae bacterium]|nr:hypothetical protein [Myxococcaceae bacterium]MCA3011211.1 hypothetical protein [Myxococcaceae bacterium]